MKPSLLLLLSVCLSSLAQTDNIITVNLENDVVHRYMTEVKYLSQNDTSRVNDYAQTMFFDKPNGVAVPIPATNTKPRVLVCAETPDYQNGVRTVVVDDDATEATIYNLVPQQTYYYKVETANQIVAKGEIHTEGQVRMIYGPTINNVRDLGGWPTTDGRRIKYGKVFRGGELNGAHVADSADLAIFTDLLGIQAELDLRAQYDEGYNECVFGFTKSTVGNQDWPTYFFTWGSGMLASQLTVYSYQYRWRKEFEFIVNNLRKNRNVYIHCVWGGDRTGYLALMLEGILGVDYDGMMKDYELTSFYSGGRIKERLDTTMNYFWGLEGETLNDKITTYFLKVLKCKQADIDYFRSVMLTDSEEDDNDDEDITTGIRRRDSRTMQTAIYGLSGQRLDKAGRKGIVIEIGNDGKVRKRLR